MVLCEDCVDYGGVRTVLGTVWGQCWVLCEDCVVYGGVRTVLGTVWGLC